MLGTLDLAVDESTSATVSLEGIIYLCVYMHISSVLGFQLLFSVVCSASFYVYEDMAFLLLITCCIFPRSPPSASVMLLCFLSPLSATFLVCGNQFSV